MVSGGFIRRVTNVIALGAMLLTSACAMVGVPETRNVDIPAPTKAENRKRAINDRPDSVMYLPLGEDVLVPEVAADDEFPKEMVGPFELRGETLAGALQLILADYDISLAFETQEGLTRRITVANLRGDLGKVVHEVCSLANLYCSYEDGTVTVKDTQTFSVTLPPIGTAEGSDFLANVATGLGAILGGTSAPIVDSTTRTIVYTATQRTSDIANRYFQRLRANTAMIVFETYIWEVSLNSGNSTGIDWFKLQDFGKFGSGIRINGSVGADFSNPVSIGLPTTSADFNGTSGDLIQFLSQFGAVKSISQPQITVLSGSEAELRVADTQNYVSQIATTLDQGQSTTSVNTDSVDTGFTLTIGSTWDKATVYANIAIELTDIKDIKDFSFSDGGDDGQTTTIQLPETSERQLSTQIRVRPGDSVLIAGLVRENDNFNTRGIGLMKPFLPDSRTAQTENLELVIMLRPRVIVYTASNDKRYVDFMMKKHHADGGTVSSSPSAAPVVDPVQEEILDGVPAPLTAQPIPTSPPPLPARMETAAPPVTTAPLSPVPLTSSATSAPSVSTPAVTPAAPSWETASPPASGSGMDDSTRFRLGEGMVSRSDNALPAHGPAPSDSAYPSASPAAPASSSVYVDPAAAPASSVYPQAAPSSSPAPAAGSSSPYDTYNYYTPSR
jgi:hypothetical protein